MIGSSTIPWARRDLGWDCPGAGIGSWRESLQAAAPALGCSGVGWLSRLAIPPGTSLRVETSAVRSSQVPMLLVRADCCRRLEASPSDRPPRSGSDQRARTKGPSRPRSQLGAVLPPENQHPDDRANDHQSDQANQQTSGTALASWPPRGHGLGHASIGMRGRAMVGVDDRGRISPTNRA